MSSSKSLKIETSASGAAILGVPVYTLGGDNGDKLRIRDNDCEQTPKIYKALSYTGYTGKVMRNENDILMMNNIIRDLGYTGFGDRDSRRKALFRITLPKLVEESQNKTFDEITDDSDDLQGQRLENIIPSKIIDIYVRREILIGSRLSGRSNILTEASNLIDGLYKRSENQNEQQYRKAPKKFQH